MTTESSPGAAVCPSFLSDWTTRLAGGWILVGGVSKLLTGDWHDLPPELAAMPVPRDVLYKFILTTELSIGLLGLVFPKTGWKSTGALLAVVAGVAAALVLQGRASCGCTNC